MGLFKPGWMSTDVQKAKKAVSKETDATTLQSIAQNAPLDAVREAAVNKLSDQAILHDIANGENDWRVCAAAVEKLTDQDFLIDITLNDKGRGNVRIWAAEKLSDQSLAQKVFTDLSENKQEKGAFRVMAAKRLIDPVLAQAVFSDVAENDRDSVARIDAVKMLTNRNLLTTILINDSEPYVCEKAQNRLNELDIYESF